MVAVASNNVGGGILLPPRDRLVGIIIPAPAGCPNGEEAAPSCEGTATPGG